MTDFDAALALNPRLAETLYKRGLTKMKLGDAAGGKTDMGVALKLNPHAGDDMKELGLSP